MLFVVAAYVPKKRERSRSPLTENHTEKSIIILYIIIDMQVLYVPELSGGFVADYKAFGWG